jgi:hypothetical protein
MNALLSADVSGRLATLVPAWHAARANLLAAPRHL